MDRDERPAEEPELARPAIQIAVTQVEIAAPAPASAKPLISDEEQFMVESFVTGFCSCPEPYREEFYESWMRCHPEGHQLLFTAWLAVDLFEDIQNARHASPAQGRA